MVESTFLLSPLLSPLVGWACGVPRQSRSPTCRSKLKLEKLVIRKGSMLDSGRGGGGGGGSGGGGGLTADELVEMLHSKDDAASDCQAAAIDDKVNLPLRPADLP